MSSIHSIHHANPINQQLTSKNNIKSNKKLTENKEEIGVVYEPDLEKIKEMKAESDERFLEIFKASIKGNFLKQAGGLRGVLEKLSSGENVKITLELEATTEDIEKAKQETSEDGYWGAKKTSDRFIEFAKALSGGDPEKAKQLKDAFIQGYEEAKECWGDELPSLCQETYSLTLEKFDQWIEEK